MASQETVTSALDTFVERGLIEDVLYVVKSGKEATVYCCSGGPAAEARLLAAKVYRSREHRGFKNDSMYREGRVIRNKRDSRAVKKKTGWGQEFAFASWLGQEYEVLSLLHRAGARVPRPMAFSSGALLMEYVGDEQMAAPPLRSVSLQRPEAVRLYHSVMENIETCLSCEQVHGDLSPYNILYWHGQITIIDFPQAVDARTNRNAYELLVRDIENVCHYFERFGVKTEPDRQARKLWGRYRHGEM